MLQGAAAAGAKVRTGRGDAFGAGGKNLGDLGALAGNCRQDGLAGQG
jgi:hypothetical protein